MRVTKKLKQDTKYSHPLTQVELLQSAEKRVLAIGATKVKSNYVDFLGNLLRDSSSFFSLGPPPQFARIVEGLGGF